jgi:hypothetical protein
MDNITDYDDVNELIRRNLSQLNLTIKSVSVDLLDIILKKSYKGNPLYILDIVDSMMKGELALINKKLVLVPTPALLKMEKDGDYSSFPVPIRIEKYVGHLLDCYSKTKEIITLKFAAVIGNFFSVSLLHSLNEFNSMTFDDILSILYDFENKGILDVMYDLNIQHSVFMFVIPFCREVLYQRMLIEQKNDLHLNIARNMQKSKFSYMPHSQELASLNQHLKLSEKSLIDYIKDDSNSKETGLLNVNNLKLCVLKEITQNIQNIENHIENSNKNKIPCVKYGDVYKKSDKNISWEKRYMAVSQNKIFYWYDKIEHETNKVPLGYVELKHLYQVEVLPDFYFGNKRNIFQIHVAQWFKKDILMGPRKFIFSCDERESVYSWIISLNFMRVKALHDEFSVNFGVVSLPLFAVEKEEKRFEKNIKKKFVRINPDENKRRANQGVSTIYNNLVRKSVVTNSSINANSTCNSSKQISMVSRASESRNQSSSIMRRVSQISGRGLTNHELESDDILEKTLKLRQQFDLLWKLGLVNFFSYIQDIIFNIDNTGQEDDLIAIPLHVDELKYLPSISGDPYLMSILKKKDKALASHQARNSIGEMYEVKEDTNESKGNNSKESLNNLSSPYANYRISNNNNNNNNTNNNNTEEDSVQINQNNYSPVNQQNKGSFSILKPSSSNNLIISNNNTNQVINSNLVSSLHHNSHSNNQQIVSSANTANFISIKNNNSNNNNSNDEEVNQNTPEKKSTTNITDFSKPMYGNEDEEKTDTNKKIENKTTGTMCVGKNLAEFDLDLENQGVDYIEQFFNQKKSERKKDKISFNSNKYPGLDKLDKEKNK